MGCSCMGCIDKLGQAGEEMGSGAEETAAVAWVAAKGARVAEAGWGEEQGLCTPPGRSRSHSLKRSCQ